MRQLKVGRVFFLLLVALLIAARAQAQEESGPLRLRLSRTFGYGAGIQAQGIFSYRVSGPDDLVRVQFLLDGQVIGEDSEPPFRLRFNTGDYESGLHTLSAVGFTADGRELASNVLQRQFVSGRSVTYIIIAVLVLVVGFRVAGHLLTRQRGTSRPGKGYGVFGGAVCARCGQPFSRHWWAPNLLAGRLDRCPHCGKWSLHGRASAQALAAAETFARELDEEEAPETPPDEREEERRRRLLDESRFDDDV